MNALLNKSFSMKFEVLWVCISMLIRDLETFFFFHSTAFVQILITLTKLQVKQHFIDV